MVKEKNPPTIPRLGQKTAKAPQTRNDTARQYITPITPHNNLRIGHDVGHSSGARLTAVRDWQVPAFMPVTQRDPSCRPTSAWANPVRDFGGFWGCVCVFVGVRTTLIPAPDRVIIVTFCRPREKVPVLARGLSGCDLCAWHLNGIAARNRRLVLSAFLLIRGCIDIMMEIESLII